MRAAKRTAAALGMALGIALVAVPAFTMPDGVRIPVKVDHDGYPAYPALFSHWEHGRYYCYTCHPSVFPQRRLGFTHADMDAGRYCGACHDGRAAFDVDDDDIECETCHREPAWTRKWGRP